jgi:hypothetical protein
MYRLVIAWTCESVFSRRYRVHRYVDRTDMQSERRYRILKTAVN